MDQKSTREFSVSVVNRMKRDLKHFDPKQVDPIIEKMEKYIETLKLARSFAKKPPKKGSKKKKSAASPADSSAGTPGKTPASPA